MSVIAFHVAILALALTPVQIQQWRQMHTHAPVYQVIAEIHVWMTLMSVPANRATTWPRATTLSPRQRRLRSLRANTSALVVMVMAALTATIQTTLAIVIRASTMGYAVVSTPPTIAFVRTVGVVGIVSRIHVMVSSVDMGIVLRANASANTAGTGCQTAQVASLQFHQPCKLMAT